MNEHDRKVKRIAGKLKRRKSRKPLSLRKKVVSHEVPKPKDKRHDDEKVDISDLDRVLEIDPEQRTCTAEPGVTFEDLVKATMEHGLIPKTVPEFRTITIGGAVAGGSLESMSYKYGGFHDSCLEYEVITAKGEVLNCTRDNENSLVFQMVHGTFGTLGIISRLKFELIPAKPFVRVEFERFDDQEEFKNRIRKHYIHKDVDFMDGFIHSPEEFVINTAVFTDDAPYTHDYEWLRVFYKSSRKKDMDYMRTEDYFFRYNGGVTNVMPLPLRFLIGKFHDSESTLSLTDRFHSVIPDSMIPVTLDVFIPFSRTDDFLEWYGEEIGHFPLWCVPYKRVRDYEWISDEFAKNIDDDLFVDLAIYGMKKNNGKNYYRMFEEELMSIKGIKSLISTNFYSEEEFWKIWNRDNYIKVKARTDPDNVFRDLYTKMCRTARGLDQ